MVRQKQRSIFASFAFMLHSNQKEGVKWQAFVSAATCNGKPESGGKAGLLPCKTFNTKSDAEKWARDIENEMDRGVFTSRIEAENTTLHEALERFIVEYVPRYNNPKLETIKARALQRRKIASKFMAAIRSKDIADFMQERAAEGVAGNTIRLDLALISRVFNVAISSWGMKSLRNPISRIPKSKVSNGRTRRRLRTALNGYSAD